ncbi:MAG TPA: arylsulfatase [Mariniphaga anaerophila]|uniref:Arylsulfatase n=1 Tax=Mariniphaga anaerophila TaxID=1484053 RepID=A0A831PPJ4_9BACT|nr:arylsulfatase [Mariniphaga anaerophila]
MLNSWLRNIFIGFLPVLGISCHSGNEQQKVFSKKPNIVIIMADDMGYSDLGCYGGEINTPHLDALAENGIRFTQFYNAARCCPTRASLLTGKYPHQVGLALNGQNLSNDAATIAEILKVNGYHTGMTGKWHLSRTRGIGNHQEQLRWLSHRKDSTVYAPLETYPSNRGFDEFWGVIWGVVNFFDPFSLVHNEEAITEIPDDFYFTDFITEKSVELIDRFSTDEKPFFLHVAHTAPHWPLHAPEEDILKYHGVYDEGWDILREKRYEKMVELGLFNPETAPLAANESGVAWDDYRHKTWEARHMEVHAAMVDRMDQGIGRIVEKLRETGQLDNTLIFFLSDNGASPERGYPPGFDRPGHKRTGDEITYIISSHDTIRPGSEGTWPYLGIHWAGAINSPFRYWKMQSYEGGINTPFIVHWPAGLKGKENSINHGVGHVIDILPTCLELAGAEYPSEINGLKTTPPEGNSLLPLFRQEIATTHDTLFWKHEGGKALRIGDWKIAALRDGDWELFNLAEDRTETKNLGSEFPEKVKGMEVEWQKHYVRLNQ